MGDGVKIWSVIKAIRYVDGLVVEDFIQDTFKSSYDFHAVDYSAYEALAAKNAELEKRLAKNKLGRWRLNGVPMTFDEQIEELADIYDQQHGHCDLEIAFEDGANAAREILQGENERTKTEYNELLEPLFIAKLDKLRADLALAVAALEKISNDHLEILGASLEIADAALAELKGGSE